TPSTGGSHARPRPWLLARAPAGAERIARRACTNPRTQHRPHSPARSTAWACHPAGRPSPVPLRARRALRKPSRYAFTPPRPLRILRALCVETRACNHPSLALRPRRALFTLLYSLFTLLYISTAI